MLLLIWEPLLIGSMVGLFAFLLTLANWMRRYGMDIVAWLLLALVFASSFGIWTAADHIVHMLGATARR